MSYSISTLLLRNLSDVFGENDAVRRRAAIDEIFHEDAVFHDPKGGIFRGRDEIDRIAGLIKATHPDFEYQPLFPPEELGDAGRVRWVSGTPGKPPAYAGTDFIVARNDRIARKHIDKSTRRLTVRRWVTSLYAAGYTRITAMKEIETNSVASPVLEGIVHS